MMNLSLQNGFEVVYEQLSGKPASQFKFTPGVTPLSTYREVALFCITYLVVIFGGQFLMRNFKPFKLTVPFLIHNAFLTMLSLALFIAFLENTLPMMVEVGLFATLCSKEAFTKQLELLCYFNYLTKYYELIDTVFMVLKKKKLTFLHWYHHSVTALLCYLHLSGRTTAAWVPITLNLGVHVFMYYYYLLTTVSGKVWWKKYITSLQIIQFVIDLAVLYFCLYSHVAFNYFPNLPTMGDCSGNLNAAVFGCSVLLSYLVLFLRFFYISYNSKASATSSSNATPSSKNSTKKKL